MKTRIVDCKGRIALGNRFAGRTVIVDDSDPDRIIVTLAVVIPASEAWLYRNKRALNSVRRGLAQAKNRQFSKQPPYLDGSGP